MTRLRWVEEAVAKSHHRSAFDCGDEEPNTFLARYARQSHDRGGSKTFVTVPAAGDPTVMGFYSVSPASIAFDEAPEVIRRSFGRHDVPAFRLARLAVDRRFQRQGLGGQLLLAAGRRCLRVSVEVGGVALLIDAKNPDVAAWYAGYGAVALDDRPLILVLPLATVAEALSAAESAI
jgi:GNAT superfamily N-acetyltransferase